MPLALSPPPPAIFVNEHCTAGENRVNLAALALASNEQFRTWWLTSLGFLNPSDLIVYPPVSVGRRRPDFVVTRDVVIGWIEVELGGENTDRLREYRAQYGEDAVKSIVGTSGGGGDLSLQEMAGFAQQLRVDKQGQIAVNMFCQLVEKLAHTKVRRPYVRPSDAVLDIPLIAAIQDRLPDILHLGHEKPRPGELLATTAAGDNITFRVYGKPEVQLFVVPVRGDNARVLALSRIRRCLKPADEAVTGFGRFFRELGVHIDALAEGESLPIPQSKLLDRVDEFCAVLRPLAEAYGVSRP